MDQHFLTKSLLCVWNFLYVETFAGLGFKFIRTEGANVVSGSLISSCFKGRLPCSFELPLHIQYRVMRHWWNVATQHGHFSLCHKTPQVAITTLFTLFLREKKNFLHAFTAELADSFITCSQLYIGFFSHRIYSIIVLGYRGVCVCVCVMVDRRMDQVSYL